MMNLPFFSGRKKAHYDACLDSFLSFLIIELETHGLFEKAWENAARQTSFPLRPCLEEALVRFRERGMGMDESLELFSRECGTTLVERMSGLLRHIYAHGSTPSSLEALQRLAEDVRMHQRIVWKAYAQKLVLLSLVFIGVSALVPALFLAFVTIGSRFLDMSLSEGDIAFVSWIGFPLLDILVLGLVWMQTPAIPQPMEDSTLNASFSIFTFFFLAQKRMDEICHANGKKDGFSGIVYSSTIEGAGLFIVVWSFFLRSNQWDAFWASLFLASVAGPFLANSLWQFISYEKTTQLLEQQAADSLLILSSIPSSVSFLDHLSWLSRVSPTPIRGAWLKVVQSIRGGKNPVNVMEKIGVGRHSPILDGVRALLIRTYESGHAFGQPARTLAQEIIFHHSSIQERRAVLLIEKYTILLAGGLLVPFLLGILTGVVSALPWSGINDFSSPNSEGLFQTALLGMRGYLMIYSLLAGVFVGMQDGKPSQGAAYSVILLPCSQVVYTIGQWWVGN